MESLGGDAKWNDRFMAQHAAVFYYWALIAAFLVSPKWSYKFSEMLESAEGRGHGAARWPSHASARTAVPARLPPPSRALTQPPPAAHAVSTYRQFIVENAEALRRLPAPKIARSYYQSPDPYLYHMDSGLVRGIEGAGPPPQPPCETLLDVFVNILEDEWVRACCS